MPQTPSCTLENRPGGVSRSPTAFARVILKVQGCGSCRSWVLWVLGCARGQAGFPSAFWAFGGSDRPGGSSTRTGEGQGHLVVGTLPKTSFAFACCLFPVLRAW